jgi:hypothetical protein
VLPGEAILVAACTPVRPGGSWSCAGLLTSGLARHQPSGGGMLVPGPPSPYTVEMEVWSHRSSYPRSVIIIIIIIIAKCVEETIFLNYLANKTYTGDNLMKVTNDKDDFLIFQKGFLSLS